MYFKVHFILLISAGLIGCATQQPIKSYQAIKVADVSLQPAVVNHTPNYRYVTDTAASVEDDSRTPHTLSTTKGNTNDKPNEHYPSSSV